MSPVDSKSARSRRRPSAAWPALETRDRRRLGPALRRRLHQKSQFNQCLRAEKLDDRCDDMNGLEAPYRERGQPPVWRLTPARPAGDGRPAGRRRLPADRRKPGPAGAPRRAVRRRSRGADRAAAVGRLARPASPTSARWRRSIATTMARMLRSIAAPVGFALVEDEGEPIAFALGVVDGDHVGLFDVLVAPQARRRGLARRLTREHRRLGPRARRALRLSAGRGDQRGGAAALRRSLAVSRRVYSYA